MAKYIYGVNWKINNYRKSDPEKKYKTIQKNKVLDEWQ